MILKIANLNYFRSEIEPSFRNILLGKSFTAGLFVERVPMTEVPDGENEQAAWLHNLYKRKVKNKKKLKIYVKCNKAKNSEPLDNSGFKIFCFCQ